MTEWTGLSPRKHRIQRIADIGAYNPARMSSLGSSRRFAPARLDVELGAKASKLKQAGLIKGLRDGCELAPNTRTAKLKAPLRLTRDAAEQLSRNWTVLLFNGIVLVIAGLIVAGGAVWAVRRQR